MDREDAIREALLGVLAGENVFLLGPPGTAKSALARRLHLSIRDGTFFSFLMSRFTTPEELFGPVSLRALKEEDRYRHLTTGYLPEASIVFLDEVWRSGPAIRNALLTVLNERVFRNGDEEVRLPAISVVGASNPPSADDDTRDAFWDRFLVRIRVASIEGDEAFARLVGSTDDSDPVVPEELRLTCDQIAAWNTLAGDIPLSYELLSFLTELRRLVATDGRLPVSDRRWRAIARLLRVAALLRGGTEASPAEAPLVIVGLRGITRDEDLDDCVTDALTRWTPREATEAERYGSAVERIETALEETRTEWVEDERSEPILIDGEYLRLLGFSDGHDVSIWQGDFGEDERPAELFFRDPDGGYSHSEVHRLRKADDATVLVDGVAFALESTFRRVSRPVGRAPEPDRIAALTQEAVATVEGLDRLLEILIERERVLVEQTQAGPFLPPQTSPPTRPYEKLREQIVRLRLRAEEVLQRMGWV